MSANPKPAPPRFVFRDFWLRPTDCADAADFAKQFIAALADAESAYEAKTVWGLNTSEMDMLDICDGGEIQAATIRQNYEAKLAELRQTQSAPPAPSPGADASAGGLPAHPQPSAEAPLSPRQAVLNAIRTPGAFVQPTDGQGMTDWQTDAVFAALIEAGVTLCDGAACRVPAALERLDAAEGGL